MESPSSAESELEARIRQQEAVADVGQRALEADELDELLEDATGTVAETLNAEYCYALELLPDRNEFLLRQGVGWQAERAVTSPPKSHLRRGWPKERTSNPTNRSYGDCWASAPIDAGGREPRDGGHDAAVNATVRRTESHQTTD